MKKNSVQVHAWKIVLKEKKLILVWWIERKNWCIQNGLKSRESIEYRTAFFGCSFDVFEQIELKMSRCECKIYNLLAFFEKMAFNWNKHISMRRIHSYEFGAQTNPTHNNVLFLLCVLFFFELCKFNALNHQQLHTYTRNN